MTAFHGVLAKAKCGCSCDLPPHGIGLDTANLNGLRLHPFDPTDFVR